MATAGFWHLNGKTTGRVGVVDLRHATGTPKLFAPIGGGAGDVVALVKLSPNGRWLFGKTVRGEGLVWDTAGEPDQGPVLQVPGVGIPDFSADGRWMAIAAPEGKTNLYAMLGHSPNDKPCLLQALPGTAPESSVQVTGFHSNQSAEAISSDGKWLFTSDDKASHLWRLDPDRPGVSEATQVHIGGAVKKFQFSPRSRWLLTAYGNHTNLWCLQPQTPTATGFDLGASVRTSFDWQTNYDRAYGFPFAFSSDDAWLATRGERTLWDLSLPDPSVPASANRALPKCCQPNLFAFSPSGNCLVFTDLVEDTTRVLDLTNPRDVRCYPLDIEGTRVAAIRFGGVAGRWLATGDQHGVVRLWDVQRLPPPYPVVLGQHEGPIASIDFAASGDVVVTSDDQSVRLWAIDQSFDALVRRAQLVVGRQLSNDEKRIYRPDAFK